MNCRALAKLLPELAAGELDEKRAAEAREHMAGCSACAQEFRKYEVALRALSAPRQMAAVPEALAFLNLPEKARKPWLRPAWAAFAAAVLLLAAILTLPLLSPKPPKAPAPVIVQHIPPKHEAPAPQPKALEAPKKQIAYHPTHHHRLRVNKRQYVAAKPKEPSAPMEIVIVSQVKLPPDSYTVEIQSTDTQSGTSTVYSTVHDEALGDQTVGITSNLNTEDTGRT